MNNQEPEFKIDLTKLTPLIEKLEYYSNIKSVLTPIFGMSVVVSSALWWYDQPQIAAFLSAATLVMGVLVLYSSLSIINYIKKIANMK